MAIYLDNAATAYPRPESVIHAVENTLRTISGSPGRGGHQGGMAAARLVLEAREALAELFCVSDSSRFIFTHSATESLNIAISGLLKPGDHVVSSTMEHNSLARPLHRAARQGVDVTWVPADMTGRIDPRDVAASIRSSTRLIALTHCSNVTGTLQPVNEIAELAHRAGALILVDAAQSAGIIPIDLSFMQIDLLAAPGHKGLMGPPGTGFLYIAEGVSPEPLLVGGTGTSSTSLDQPDDLPERYESGTQNAPALAGLLAGISFVSAIGVAAVARHEAEIMSRLIAGLKDIPRVKMYGPGANVERGSVLSFTVDGIDPADIGHILDRDFAIAVRTGLHCSPAAHRTIGTFPTGTVRVSPGYFNTIEDIDEFIRATKLIEGKF